MKKENSWSNLGENISDYATLQIIQFLMPIVFVNADCMQPRHSNAVQNFLWLSSITELLKSTSSLTLPILKMEYI